MKRYIDWNNSDRIRAPEGDEKILVVNSEEFASEGEECDARRVPGEVPGVRRRS
jgi:hypothetical protein